LRSLPGGSGAAKELECALEAISGIWETQLPEAIESAVSLVNGDELLRALKSGAVELPELGESSSLVADSHRAATGDVQVGAVDDVMGGFLARVLEMLTEGDRSPYSMPHRGPRSRS
jgi:hypothetical protein